MAVAHLYSTFDFFCVVFCNQVNKIYAQLKDPSCHNEVSDQDFVETCETAEDNSVNFDFLLSLFIFVVTAVWVCMCVFSMSLIALLVFLMKPFLFLSFSKLSGI